LLSCFFAAKFVPFLPFQQASNVLVVLLVAWRLRQLLVQELLMRPDDASCWSAYLVVNNAFGFTSVI
jgi:hypothetical protein